jgi:hypothetical protein
VTDPGGVLLDRERLERAFTALGDRLVRGMRASSLRVLGVAAQFVLDGQANPGRRAQAGAVLAAGWPLRILVFRQGVEGVLLIGCQPLIVHKLNVLHTATRASRRRDSVGGRHREPHRLHKPPGREVAEAGEATLQVLDLLLWGSERPQVGVERPVLGHHLVDRGR